MKKILPYLLLLTLLIFLLLSPTDALAASRTGLLLWFDTLLPTLLPFLIISNILIRANLIPKLTGWMSPFFRRVLGISSSGTYAMIAGFLCGYPVGAKILAQLKTSGQIPAAEAQYLLSFCNNASPAFLITFLVNEQLHRPNLALPTLMLVYGSPLLYGLLQNPKYRRSLKNPLSRLFIVKKAPIIQINFELIDACILDAVLTITKLGAYIILFSILSKIIESLSFLPAAATSLCIGLTEITNGISYLASRYPFAICYPLLIMLTTFGGFSSLAQTQSVTSEAHFSIRNYLQAKILSALIAGSGAVLYLRLI